MIVRRDSWHTKAYMWMKVESPEVEKPSVCNYWSTVLIGLPLVCVLFVILAPVVLLVEWCERLLDGKITLCPFGKVEIKD